MALSGLRLENWKSFGTPADLKFGAVTFLVGPNASGKSNVLDALRFVQGCALGLSFADALRGRYEGQREIWPGIRGGVAEAARHPLHEFGMALALPDPRSSDGLALFLAVTTDGEPRVKYESLVGRTPEAPFWYSVSRSDHLEAPGFSYAAVSIRGLAEQRTIDPLHLTLGRLPSANGATEDASARARDVHEHLRELIFLDVQPHRMRDYRPDTTSQLGVNAENISPILYQLQRDAPDQLANVVDWLGELCAPQIEAIEFDRTRLGEVMMFLVEGSGAKISARSASDGTLRFLGLVAALLTVPPGSTLLMEEPDVGLHPSRLHLLTSLFEQTAKRRDLQIIATTHSPTLLAHLSPSALADVLAFGRDPATAGSVAERAGDLPQFATLRDADNLERLISNGWLERAL